MKPNDCDSPFKPEGSPFFVLPGLTSPERVMIDSAHTWHIGIPSCNIKLCIYIYICTPGKWFSFHVLKQLRIGKDYVSSGVVLLAKLKLFPGRESLGHQLHHAYKLFLEWCARCGKNTNIDDFSKREFKMGTTLDIYRFSMPKQP